MTIAPSPSSPSIPFSAESRTIRRELYFFNLFRVLQATIVTGMAFSPVAMQLVQLRHSTLAQADALIYLVLALVIFANTNRWASHLRTQVAFALSLDIVMTTLAMFAFSDPQSGMAMLLMVNVGAGALLLPPRLAGFFAALAALAMLLQCLYVRLVEFDDRSLLEAGLLGLGYFASTALCFVLSKQMRETEALAERRGVDVANLAQLNELIVRRMQTGVLIVDDANQIHRMNESAWQLLGEPAPNERDLGTVAPELSRRLYHWRHGGKQDITAVALAEAVPEVVPRFTRLAANNDTHTLIFLDDTSLVSRQAEELTLSSLGRLSASIAHEIRNPLTAISYSAQLLAESEELTETDKRMVEIINSHCGRVNEIIENILQLSRRDRSRPESLDLNHWAVNFVEEYSASNDLGQDQLRVVSKNKNVESLCDPQHLQQVVWNLVQNALRYGRMPGEPARVTLVVRRASEKGTPLLEVIDRGPGIPAKVAAQIFEPFFSTQEYGTGLGLYLARQMCEVNQATLEYVPLAGGGSCFRITLSTPLTARN